MAGGQSNPYYEEATGSQASHARQKQSRQLIFNQKGKYIQQANALRKQAALEALKKRIAQQTRRAGMDEDLEGEKNFVVEAPPELEWFDAGLVDGKSYDSIEEPGSLKIDTDDSIITAFIQHPVPLEPPQDALVPVAKPLYLTPKEQARLRRQRRSAALKEEQSQISLGLIPAPPPKIKKGNLMRVLGSIDDPTAVELRVNQEIAARHQKHTAANEERKLTKEQMHEKLVANQERDASKGLHMMVFKIGSLVNGSHRYKIGVNAEQLFLTGMCIMSPRFSLVIVEGGEWSMTKYRKLLMNRMDWTENAPSRDREEKKAALREWLRAEDEGGGLKDLSKNQCTLVFKGEVKSRPSSGSTAALPRAMRRRAKSSAESRWRRFGARPRAHPKQSRGRHQSPGRGRRSDMAAMARKATEYGLIQLRRWGGRGRWSITDTKQRGQCLSEKKGWERNTGCGALY